MGSLLESLHDRIVRGPFRASPSTHRLQRDRSMNLYQFRAGQGVGKRLSYGKSFRERQRLLE